MLGIISKLYKIQGTNITKAITIGNSIVQQKSINWSKRILGKEALTHINVNIIKQAFNPKFKLVLNPWINTVNKLTWSESKSKRSNLIISK